MSKAKKGQSPYRVELLHSYKDHPACKLLYEGLYELSKKGWGITGEPHLYGVHAVIAYEKSSGKLVGTIAYSVSAGEGEINLTFVKKKHRGNGLMQLMYQKAREAMIAQNANVIVGRAHIDNKSSIRAIQKSGRVLHSYLFKEILPCNKKAE